MHIARITDPNLDEIPEIFGIPQALTDQCEEIASEIIYKTFFTDDKAYSNDCDSIEAYIKQLPDNTLPQHAFIFG